MRFTGPFDTAAVQMFIHTAAVKISTFFAAHSAVRVFFTFGADIVGDAFGGCVSGPV